MKECEERLEREAKDKVEIIDGPPLPPPDEKPPDEKLSDDKSPGDKSPEGEIEHYSVGKPKDGIIYLNNDGERCKIDAKGRPYRVGSDGEFDVEEWKKLSAKERDVIIRRERLKEEAEKLKEIKAKKEKEKKEKAEKAKKAESQEGKG
eukprot:s8799_g1.t1